MRFFPQIFFVFVFVFQLTQSVAQTPFFQVWGGTGEDRVWGITEGQDGSLFLVGEELYVWGGKGMLRKLSPTGNVEWTQDYFGPTATPVGSWLEIHEVHERPNGNLVVVGTCDQPGVFHTNVGIMETDTLGNPIWAAEMGGGNYNEGWGIHPDGPNSYVISGASVTTNLNWQTYYAKVDSGGTIVWEHILEYYFGLEVAFDIFPTDSGYFMPLGNEVYPDSRMAALFTNSVGDSLASYRYFPHSWNNAGITTFDGGFALAGYYEPASSNDRKGYFVKANAQGDTIFTRIYEEEVISEFFDIQQTPDSGFIAVGYSNADMPGSINTYDDVILLKLDKNGNQEWLSTWQLGYDDWGMSVTRTSDGCYIVGGTTQQLPGTHEFFVLKADSNGCFMDSVPSSITASDTVVCQNDTVQLQGTTGSLGYLWSTGEFSESISVTDPGWYTLSNGHTCINGSFSESIYIATLPLPEPQLVPDSVVMVCPGDSLTVATAANWSSQIWSNGATSPSLPISLGNDSCSFEINLLDSAGNGWSGGALTLSVNGSFYDSLMLLNGADSAISLLVSNGDLVEFELALSGTNPTEIGFQLADPYGSVSLNYPPSTIPSGVIFDTLQCPSSATVAVLVTDTNGCVNASDSVTLIVEEEMELELTVSDTLVCEGETITIWGTDGFDQYQWSTGETEDSLIVAQSGGYDLTATQALGCYPSQQASVNLLFEAPPEPNIVVLDTTDQCEGDTLILQSDSTYFQYMWSNGATSGSIATVSYGAYTLTVTSELGCEGTSDPIWIDFYSPQTLEILNPGTDFCENHLVFYQATAGFASYLWSNNSTQESTVANTGGDWYVSGIDIHGCESFSDTIFLTLHPFPDVDLIVTPNVDTICEGDTVILDVGPGFQSHSWSNGFPFQSIAVTQSGAYYATVVDTHLCQVNTDTVELTVIDCSIGIAEQGRGELSVWPNPASNQLYLSVAENDIIRSVQLLSPLGKRVSMKNEFPSSQMELEIGHLSSGIWVLQVETNGAFIRRSFVIAR